MTTTIRVLVIDDSAFNRQTISAMLDEHPEIEVVGKAFDGEEGLKLAAQLKPDLITLDVEMPRMDGFTFLRILMSRMPTPVIMISSHSRKDEVFQALELGALDFIAKPGHHVAPGLASLREELIAKTLMVRSLQAMPFAESRKRRRQIEAVGSEQVALADETAQCPAARVVCIGASTGGPPALESIFKALPAAEGTAYLVAQHMPAKFTRAFAERLNRMSRLTIVEAEDGCTPLAQHVYVAPGGRHLLVQGDDGARLLRVRNAVETDRYSPSIDLLFESAAKWFGAASLAVVLTGMGSDGRAGVEAIRAAGGKTLAESSETAVVFGMPKEAIESGCVDVVLPLPAIVDRLHVFARDPTLNVGT